eukprot:11280870-Alexandrium_andersonii.AAC.1
MEANTNRCQLVLGFRPRRTIRRSQPCLSPRKCRRLRALARGAQAWRGLRKAGFHRVAALAASSPVAQRGEEGSPKRTHALPVWR